MCVSRPTNPTGNVLTDEEIGHLDSLAEEQGIPLIPLPVLNQELNGQLKVPAFPASAIRGTNVVATLKRIISMSVATIKNDLK